MSYPVAAVTVTLYAVRGDAGRNSWNAMHRTVGVPTSKSMGPRMTAAVALTRGSVPSRVQTAVAAGVSDAKVLCVGPQCARPLGDR